MVFAMQEGRIGCSFCIKGTGIFWKLRLDLAKYRPRGYFSSLRSSSGLTRHSGRIYDFFVKFGASSGSKTCLSKWSKTTLSPSKFAKSDDFSWKFVQIHPEKKTIDAMIVFYRRFTSIDGRSSPQQLTKIKEIEKNQKIIHKISQTDLMNRISI